MLRIIVTSHCADLDLCLRRRRLLSAPRAPSQGRIGTCTSLDSLHGRFFSRTHTNLTRYAFYENYISFLKARLSRLSAPIFSTRGSTSTHAATSRKNSTSAPSFYGMSGRPNPAFRGRSGLTTRNTQRDPSLHTRFTRLKWR